MATARILFTFLPGCEFGSVHRRHGHPALRDAPHPPSLPTAIPEPRGNPNQKTFTHNPPKNMSWLLAPLAPQHTWSIMRLYKVFYYSEGVGMIPLRFNYGI